jgi:hypothetical protein
MIDARRSVDGGEPAHSAMSAVARRCLRHEMRCACLKAAVLNRAAPLLVYLFSTDCSGADHSGGAMKRKMMSRMPMKTFLGRFGAKDIRRCAFRVTALSRS